MKVIYEFKTEHEYPHFFADQQYCLKCGKWEGDDDNTDDCIMSHELATRIRDDLVSGKISYKVRWIDAD